MPSNVFKCKECEKVFDNIKDFHRHFKSHGLTVAEYYVKNFHKKDLFTGDLLPFKDVDSYFLKDFRNKNNFYSWCSQGNITKEYVLKSFNKRVTDKGWLELPCQTEIKTVSSCFLPDIKYIKHFFGTCSNFAKELNIGLLLNEDINLKYVNSSDAEEHIKIAVDTREQIPFNFKNQVKMKLDIGDYTAIGDLHSNTYIDRKNPQDFIQTITTGFDRFSRELERVKDLNAYLFIVVEDSIENLLNQNKYNFHKANMEYVFSKMNEFQHKYPKNCQFVFAKNRDIAKKLILKILYNGKKLWGVDLQYILDNKQ